MRQQFIGHSGAHPSSVDACHQPACGLNLRRRRSFYKCSGGSWKIGSGCSNPSPPPPPPLAHRSRIELEQNTRGELQSCDVAPVPPTPSLLRKPRSHYASVKGLPASTQDMPTLAKTTEKSVAGAVLEKKQTPKRIGILLNLRVVEELQSLGSALLLWSGPLPHTNTTPEAPPQPSKMPHRTARPHVKAAARRRGELHLARKRSPGSLTACRRPKSSRNTPKNQETSKQARSAPTLITFFQLWCW